MSTPENTSQDSQKKPEDHGNDAQRPAVHGADVPAPGQNTYGPQSAGRQAFRQQGGPDAQFASGQHQTAYGSQSFGQPDPRYGTSQPGQAQPGQGGSGAQGFGQGGGPQYDQRVQGQQGFGGQFGQQPAFGQQNSGGGFGSIFSTDFTRVFTPSIARIVHLLAIIVGVAIIVLGFFSFITMLTQDYVSTMVKFEYFFDFLAQTAIGIFVIGASRVFLEFFVKNADRKAK